MIQYIKLNNNKLKDSGISCHSSFIYRGHMYIFGGIHFECDNKLMRIDLNTFEMTEVILSSDVVPLPRASCSLLLWKEKK